MMTGVEKNIGFFGFRDEYGRSLTCKFCNQDVVERLQVCGSVVATRVHGTIKPAMGPT